MPAAFRKLSPVLFVERVEPSLAFFRDRLGFAVETEVPSPGGDLVFAICRRDAVEVMIQRRDSLGDDLGGDLAPAVASALRGAWCGLYLEVDDIDRLIPEVADADVLVPSRRTWYGAHEITVREPGGHAVTFSSPAASASPA